MRQADGNPTGNRLGAGITEDALRTAITRSGYPMQAAVIAAFKEAVAARWADERSHGQWASVQEEWTYVDSDTDDVRAIDALAEVHLWQAYSELQPRIRPMLSLLIECKQSELPHVFFTRPDHHLPQFPSTTGFPYGEVTLSTNDDRSTYTFEVTDLWGLTEHKFIIEPPVAVSLSKARRKSGTDLEVTGDDTYRSLTLPLLKATAHLDRATGFSNTHFTDGRLVIPLAVIRGPMVAVQGDGQGDLEAVPWVRVQRYEPEPEPRRWRSHKLLAYDVVHEEFLPTYLQIAMDYADRFASSVATHQKVLLSGRGFAKGLGGWAGPVEVEPLMTEARAAAPRASAKRGWAVALRWLHSIASRET
jgi:hypothetical protein